MTSPRATTELLAASVRGENDQLCAEVNWQPLPLVIGLKGYDLEHSAEDQEVEGE